VIAFEPTPSNFLFLKNQFPQATIEGFALANQIGEVEFLHSKDLPARSRISSPSPETSQRSKRDIQLVVPVTTLDDYFKDDDRIDFIKIDAEGAELSILKGGLEILKRSRPILILEHGRSLSDDWVEASSEVFNILHQEIGLRVFVLEDKLRDPIKSTGEFLAAVDSGHDYFFSRP